MPNSREFIDRLESADVEELAELVRHPTDEEEEALRDYLGPSCYQRLHILSLKWAWRRGASSQGNVVVIPDITGTVLSSETSSREVEAIWPRARPLIEGKLERLKLAEDGRTEADRRYVVRATGIAKRLYGELLLSLALNWRVHAFWYDWRKDLRQAAQELATDINRTFGNASVHLVGHGVGGLVARTYLQRYATRWGPATSDRTHDASAEENPTHADRNEPPPPPHLVMLGTPNYGAFAFLQPFLGLGPIIQMLGVVDEQHDINYFCGLVSSFPGLYQLLPSPAPPGFIAAQKVFVEKLYEADTYRRYGASDQPGVERELSRQHLRNALDYHKEMAEGLIHADRQGWLYIAGDDHPTLKWLGDPTPQKPSDYFSEASHRTTRRGDGLVPHSLGRLPQVTTYYVREDHGGLVSNPQVLTALDAFLAGQTADRLLEDKTVDGLSTTPQSGAAPPQAGEVQERQEKARKTLRDLAQRTRTLITASPSRGRVVDDELEIERLTSGILFNYRAESDQIHRAGLAWGVTRIRIQLVYGGIETIHQDARLAGPVADGPEPRLACPVDAVAVGHYTGVFPTERSAQSALDRSISAALWRRAGRSESVLPPSERLLWKYSERGTLRGELGQVFVLPDPRVELDTAGANDRVIAIAGMGVPGRFGEAELTVMARELCWALGRLGRRHLATTLIGGGVNNLAPTEAIKGWIRGLKYAVTGMAEDDPWRLNCLTFVEIDPNKCQEIDKAIRSEQKRLNDEKRLTIDYQGFLPPPDLDPQQSSRRGADLTSSDEPEKAPTRMTVTRERDVYRFGAITHDASIPERDIPLDPELVADANKELVAEQGLGRQVERGQFLARLLLPRDLREHFFTDTPLVMMLDRATARLHWEMMAQPDLLPGAQEQSEEALPDLHQYFLGTSRGFTRQLRTGFAPPPDPPLNRRRLLRVLVIADPASDRRLPAAEKEGIEVADLFESFNRLNDPDKRVEVVRLFGPREADRSNVLFHLDNRSYDVLHFAGHCAYDENDPSASGWIFSNDRRLTAREIQRIDRIPNFVFSNACESGVTPDEPENRSPDLAPSFAEAFFERGVSNFVCTAWPVYDAPACRFARHLYAQLLGLDLSSGGPLAQDPQPMFRAMQAARRAIFDAEGARTWGAYQHYGNPYLRFFQSRSTTEEGRDAQRLAPTTG